MIEDSCKRSGEVPRSAAVYAESSYWDSRFESEDHYEWLKGYGHFRHLLLPLLSPNASLLELGCGSSRLAEELRSDSAIGPVTCTDLSPVAVRHMRDRLDQCGILGIDVIVADMLDLPFDSESFDIVIEKGTMDVLFVEGGDPWNPNLETVNKTMKMLEGVHRVLKPEGMFISISFGQPHFRRPFFEAPTFSWSVEYITFGDDFHYFFYVLRKGKRPFDFVDSQKKVQPIPVMNLFHDELDNEDYIFRTTVDEE